MIDLQRQRQHAAREVNLILLDWLIIRRRLHVTSTSPILYHFVNGFDEDTLLLFTHDIKNIKVRAQKGITLMVRVNEA